MMKLHLQKWFCLFLSGLALCNAAASDLKIWYDAPGANGSLSQDLLIGNGRMGALISGQVVGGQIFLDDSSLWMGTANPSGTYNTTDPNGFGDYQYFGTLNITNSGQLEFSNYSREMDIGDAIARVTYSVGTTNYYREYFCSHPDDVMVIHLTASAPGAYSGTLSYTDAHGANPGYTSTNITASGTVAGSEIQWALNVHVVNYGGTMAASPAGITYTHCNSLIIIVSAGTSYVMDPAVNYLGADPSNRIAAIAAKAETKSYNTLLCDHLADYHSLFDRVTINLGRSSAEQKASPTNMRIINAATRPDPELETLMFQNARYLLIACSRPGGLPPNLQGLWNASTSAPWASDYHTDINVQMCLWPAESAALPECAETLMDLVNSQIPLWRKRVDTLDPRMMPHGVPRGWTVRVSHNITGGMGWVWNQPGNAWYCLHYWEHYLFTGDTDYLATNAYPVMKECCEFWHDCLKSVHGKLEAPYCWSPEHGPWTDGASYDEELIWNLFDNFIQASTVLHTDATFRALIAQQRDQLLKPKIGCWGQLQEWPQDLDSPTDYHRHTSQLISVYPADEITPDGTPELATAAKVSLIARGETGDSKAEWANAWRTALWARLGDGDSAHHRLSLLFADHEVNPNFVMNMGSVGQWDGTFGIAAGMIEMLLQSHEGYINLLPALSSAWPCGSVTGLRVRGGFGVDMTWTNGCLVRATIHSLTGTCCTVRYGNQSRRLTMPLGNTTLFVPLPPGVPLPPTYLSVATITNTTLTWNPANSGLCTYNIKYSAHPGGPYRTLVTGIHGTYYITPMAATNCFVVSTVRDGIESINSREATSLPHGRKTDQPSFMRIPQ